MIRIIANSDLRDYLFKKQVFHYELAKALDMDCSEFSKLLRYELPKNQKIKYMSIIDDIAKRKQRLSYNSLYTPL